ncbi:heat shock factor protein 2-like [Parasteatoda tepidariorum]|uniref:heat shock factor protein 2-like n=1 Tax=Parasteatoda tepidariorum TaxID=114398 RepID=UPI00077FB0C2|nr:heat shock factor protein 2-like [Parasteatoda tepidariorum]
MLSQAYLKNQAPNNNVPSPLRFPQKLWKIANECQSGAVTWSPHGKSILLRYSLFKEEFMSIKNDFFKTDNISSFVRQLNLYGFRKVYDYTHKHTYKINPDLHEFSNVHFQRDRPDLLDKVTRKSGALKERNGYFFENQYIQEESDGSPDIKEEFEDEMYLEEEPSNKENVDYDSILNSLQLPVLFIEDKPLFLSETTESAVSENDVVLEPVKKKRGRKPGSKTTKKTKCVFIPKSTKYFIPTFKHPEIYPNLIYFDDEDDSIFLRNTSRDVMLSSTLPFQESPEFLELKETHQKLYPPKVRLRYSSLPVSIPYSDPTFTENRKKYHDF